MLKMQTGQIFTEILESEEKHSKHDCLSPNHIFHVCAMKGCGLNEENCEDFAEITNNPKFRCRICGAVAANATNLCDPESI